MNEGKRKVSCFYSLYDIDYFLTTVESKLRDTFSSMDLTKAISSYHYLLSIVKAFNRMEKNIKLRVLISFLGFKPFFINSYDDKILNPENNKKLIFNTQDLGAKLDSIILNLFFIASKDEDEWVRILSGIVRGKIFLPPRTHDINRNNLSFETNYLYTFNHINEPIIEGYRTKETVLKLRRTAKKIINLVLKYSDRVDKLNKNVTTYFLKKKKEGEVKNRKISILNETKIFLSPSSLNVHLDPFYLPYWFRMINPTILYTIIPELAIAPHFKVNERANILSIDSILIYKKIEKKINEVIIRAHARSNLLRKKGTNSLLSMNKLNSHMTNLQSKFQTRSTSSSSLDHIDTHISKTDQNTKNIVLRSKKKSTIMRIRDNQLKLAKRKRETSVKAPSSNISNCNRIPTLKSRKFSLHLHKHDEAKILKSSISFRNFPTFKKASKNSRSI